MDIHDKCIVTACNDMENIFQKNLQELIGKQSAAAWAIEKKLPVRLIQRYVNKGTPPAFDKLFDIAAACNVRVGWLAAGELPKELISYDITDPATEFFEKFDAGAYRTKDEILAAIQSVKTKLQLIKGGKGQNQNGTTIDNIDMVYKRKIDKLDKETRELFEQILLLQKKDFRGGYCRVVALVEDRMEILGNENLKKTSGR